jgi:hypothetical protein
MEVHFPPDLQEKLMHSAEKQGREAEDLVQEVLAQYLTWWLKNGAPRCPTLNKGSRKRSEAI